MTNENYSSQGKVSVRSGEGEEPYDPWTKRIDLILKAAIAIVTILTPVYLHILTQKAKEEIKTEARVASGEAKAAVTEAKESIKEVQTSLDAHDKELEEVKEIATYTKAVNADWLAGRTGSEEAAAQAEQARTSLEAMGRTSPPPFSLPTSAAPPDAP